jgi:uncharacterized protein
VALTAPVLVGVAAFGFLVGGLSALLGVGGGLIMVPLLALALDVGQHAAEGTSLLVIVPTAAAGVIVHSRAGYVSFYPAAFLGLGGILGSYLGALLALEVDGDALRTAFGIFTILMGVRLIRQGNQAA